MTKRVKPKTPEINRVKAAAPSSATSNGVDEETVDEAETEEDSAEDSEVLDEAEMEADVVDEAPAAPKAPRGKQAVLHSPQDFGIHIAGVLHRFRKGKTLLTPEQEAACLSDSYVKDNGAEVLYR